MQEISLSGTSFIDLLKATLNKKASFRFQANGFSMSPFIKDGDVITISPLINGSIGIGKPVAFIHFQTGKLVVHRVVGRYGNNYLIKGDRSTEADGLIPRKNILGIVTRVEREDRAIQLGMGPERFIIAFLSKVRFLSLIFWIWRKARYIAG